MSELAYLAQFPESLYEPLLRDWPRQSKFSASTSLAETKKAHRVKVCFHHIFNKDEVLETVTQSV